VSTPHSSIAATERRDLSTNTARTCRRPHSAASRTDYTSQNKATAKSRVSTPRKSNTMQRFCTSKRIRRRRLYKWGQPRMVSSGDEWRNRKKREGCEFITHLRATLFSHGPRVGWQSRRQEYEKTGMRRKLRQTYHKARQNTFSIKVTRPKYTALCECDHYVRTASFKYAVECRLLLDKRVQIRTGTGKPTHKRGLDHDGVSEPANGFNHPQG